MIPNSILEYRKSLWKAACEEQGTEPESLFVVFAEGNVAATVYNNFCLALGKAIDRANKTQSSVLIYQSTHRRGVVEFGVDFTLPTFGVRIGDRIYPSNSSSTSPDNGCE